MADDTDHFRINSNSIAAVSQKKSTATALLRPTLMLVNGLHMLSLNVIEFRAIYEKHKENRTRHAMSIIPLPLEAWISFSRRQMKSNYQKKPYAKTSCHMPYCHANRKTNSRLAVAWIHSERLHFSRQFIAYLVIKFELIRTPRRIEIRYDRFRSVLALQST